MLWAEQQVGAHGLMSAALTGNARATEGHSLAPEPRGVCFQLPTALVMGMGSLWLHDAVAPVQTLGGGGRMVT